MNKRVAILALAGLGTLMLAVACTSNDTVQVIPGGAQAQGISVTGTGEASAAPDLALLTVGVSVLRDSVREAREEAAEAMNAVIDSIKDNGVADEDIQTRRFSIQPDFDFDDGRRELRGFRVTNIVSAKLRDLDRVGDIIDDAAEAGEDAVEIQGLNFTIDDPDELQAQARDDAVADARAKAERLAELAGVKLGDPISISEGGFRLPQAIPLGAVALDEAARAPTPIEIGELEVSVSVSVVFAIE